MSHPYEVVMPTARQSVGVFAPILVGAAVAVALGVYGRLHEPTGIAVNIVGFSSPLTVKVWLTSVAMLLGLIQLFTALVMYDKLPGFRATDGISSMHRWSGRIAFLLTVPVAVHCLYALGFASYDTRTLAHSILGCFFYGVFTVKMLVLSRPGSPGWALPMFGGLVFTGLTLLWLTSSFWFFTTIGVQL